MPARYVPGTPENRLVRDSPGIHETYMGTGELADFAKIRKRLRKLATD